MRSDDVLKTIKTVIAADLASGKASVIDFMLTNLMSGGWEGWLQVVSGKAVLEAAGAAQGSLFREAQYPGTALRADLLVAPLRGTRIWIEMKTMRSKAYLTAWTDFANDVAKIEALPGTTIKTDIMVATCILIATAADLAAMVAFVKARTSGTAVGFSIWDAGRKSWAELTVDKVPAGALLLASWKNG